MKILLQKVLSASVTVNNKVVSAIDSGYLLFVGIEKNDTKAQADYLVKKV